MKHIMEGFDKFISYNDAINIFDSIEWKYPDKENIDINNSLNRISYDDVYSNMDIPEFNKSAVDGYALRSEDVINASINNPARLKITGTVEADQKFSGKINENECVEIYTGSEIPDGSDAVVKVEDTEKDNNYIYVYSSIKKDNIFKKGEDISNGYKIINKNEKILPQHIAAMASVKIKNIDVYKKIRIGIISTGNELINKKIVNSTGILLKNYYNNYFIETLNGGIYGDNNKDIINGVKNIIDKCDIIIITGGTSLGRKDNTTDAISSIGKLLFSGIAIKPGRTMALFNLNNKPVLSVSGLPVAALLSSLIFVNQYIKNLYNFDYYNKINGILDENIHNKIGFTLFQICKIYIKNNEIHVLPLKTTGSGILSTIIYGNSIVMVPENIEGIENNKNVTAYIIGDIKWD